MSSFLFELEGHCTDSLPPPDNKAYRRQIERYEEMDQQLLQAMGRDFRDEYTQLWYDLTQWELTDHFRAGLKFGLQLAAEVFSAP